MTNDTLTTQDLLGQKPLKSANMSTKEEEIIKTTVSEWTYKEKKNKLKIIYSSKSVITEYQDINIKEAY